MTQRTLLRRLEGERTSFQSIKDGMRRDELFVTWVMGEKTSRRLVMILVFHRLQIFIVHSRDGQMSLHPNILVSTEKSKSLVMGSDRKRMLFQTVSN